MRLLLLVVVFAGCEWLDETQLPCLSDSDCFSEYHCEGADDPEWGRCAEGAPADDPVRGGGDGGGDDDDAVDDDDVQPDDDVDTEISGVLVVEHTRLRQPDAYGGGPDDGRFGGAEMRIHLPVVGTWLSAPAVNDCEVNMAGSVPSYGPYANVGEAAMTGSFGSIGLEPDDDNIYHADEAPQPQQSFGLWVGDYGLDVPNIMQMPALPAMTSPSTLWQDDGVGWAYAIGDELTLAWQPDDDFDVLYVILYGYWTSIEFADVAIYCTAANDGSFTLTDSDMAALPSGAGVVVRATHQFFERYAMPTLGAFEVMARTHLGGTGYRE